MTINCQLLVEDTVTAKPHSNFLAGGFFQNFVHNCILDTKLSKYNTFLT